MSAIGVHGGGRRQESLGVRVAGMTKDFRGESVLDDPSVLHNGDSVFGSIAGLGDDR